MRGTGCGASPVASFVRRWRQHGGWRRSDRTNPGNDLPKIVRCLDGGTHGRHWALYGPVLQAFEAFLLQTLSAERYQAEQRVVFAAEEPDPLVQGRAHATAASPTVTAVTARCHELLVAFFCDLGEVLIRTLQLSLGHLLHQFGRWRSIPSLATATRRRNVWSSSA